MKTKKQKFLDEIYEKQDVWATGSDINSINSNYNFGYNAFI